MAPAVLLISFNRPALTRRVLQALRAANVTRLYVAVDGPRPNRPDDLKATAEVRAMASEIDWTAEVLTLFREENLGCKTAVVSAINWFFRQEGEGIILEDDCVPAPSFFRYCDELLERFRDDERIAQICGSTFIPPPRKGSYWYSKYADIWGWATWRRSWRLADMSMAGWPEWRDSGGLAKLPGSTPGFVAYWTRRFDESYAGRVDTWDFAWMFACWRRGLLSVLPATPQVENIGFGPDATHTRFFDRVNPQVSQKAQPLTFPLGHVENPAADVSRERAFTRIRYSVDGLAEASAVIERLGPLGQLSVRVAKDLRFRIPWRSRYGQASRRSARPLRHRQNKVKRPNGT
jgi:hypothetical protein